MVKNKKGAFEKTSEKQGIRQRQIGKKAQVWIETVLYTLIGLGLIGMVLAFAMPKITDAKDKATIEQAIASLNEMDEKINAISDVSGNTRNYEITLRKGELLFNLEDDKIVMTIDGLRKLYSEEGAEIKQGRVTIKSIKGQKENSVELTLAYFPLNLLWKTGEMIPDNTEKKLTAAPTPYQLAFESKRFKTAEGVTPVINEMQIIVSETGA